MQNAFLRASSEQEDDWAPFHRRIEQAVIPATRSLLAAFRTREMDVIFAANRLPTRGWSRSIAEPEEAGWNNLLLPLSEWSAQIVGEVAPLPNEIVVTKTTDSALTGTHLRLVLANLGIRQVVCTGIFTDQCVSSTVRRLADESFDVLVAEDACAAGTEGLHRHELTALNMIYCSVMSSEDIIAYLRRRVTSLSQPASLAAIQQKNCFQNATYPGQT